MYHGVLKTLRCQEIIGIFRWQRALGTLRRRGGGGTRNNKVSGVPINIKAAGGLGTLRGQGC